MTKLGYDVVMECLNDGRSINRDKVYAHVLKRKVWVAANGLPGCLYDHTAICERKADAIDAALFIADIGEGTPRGMKTALQKYHSFQIEGYRYEIYQTTIGNLL